MKKNSSVVVQGYEFGVDVRLELETGFHDPNGIAKGHRCCSRENAPRQRIDCGRHVGKVLV